MVRPDKWITIKVPRNLKTEFDKRENSFADFTQFAQYALRRELERLEAQG